MENRVLAFFDPAYMMSRVDAQNEATHWKLDDINYKDRGTEVRYDVPEPDPNPLDYWKTRNPYPCMGMYALSGLGFPPAETAVNARVPFHRGYPGDLAAFPCQIRG